MRIKDLLDRWSFLLRIDVPNLKLACKSANEQMISVHLVEERRALLIFNGVADGARARLDVDVADQNLLAVEA